MIDFTLQTSPLQASASRPKQEAIVQPQIASVTPTIAILLCTFNGGQFITQQMESIANQTHRQWFVRVSDDGSSDQTLAILQAYVAQWGPSRISIETGPKQGFVANFLSLTCHCSSQADFYAYADQDDIWEADKLERAVCRLAAVPPEIPAMYCTRSRLINIDNKTIGLSPLFKKPPSFANALIQNIGGGNTMVFNRAALNLLHKAGDQLNIISHDWWVYLVVSGCGGQVFYDEKPSILYRQHHNNVIGINSSCAARLRRICMLRQGRFRRWNDVHIHNLIKLQDSLSSESLSTLRKFIKARDLPFFSRLINLKNCGIYRQTLLGNLGLIAAAIMNKI